MLLSQMILQFFFSQIADAMGDYLYIKKKMLVVGSCKNLSHQQFIKIF